MNEVYVIQTLFKYKGIRYESECPILFNGKFFESPEDAIKFLDSNEYLNRNELEVFITKLTKNE